MNLDLWKQRKKELKLKYEDISELSGIPLTTVKNIFCGYVKTPRIDTVQAIERALGIETDKHKKIGLTADQEEILNKAQQVIDELGERGKNLIIDFCDTLLEKLKK